MLVFALLPSLRSASFSAVFRPTKRFFGCFGAPFRFSGNSSWPFRGGLAAVELASCILFESPSKAKLWRGEVDQNCRESIYARWDEFYPMRTAPQ